MYFAESIVFEQLRKILAFKLLKIPRGMPKMHYFAAT